MKTDAFDLGVGINKVSQSFAVAGKHLYAFYFIILIDGSVADDINFCVDAFLPILLDPGMYKAVVVHIFQSRISLSYCQDHERTLLAFLQVVSSEYDKI